MMGFESYCSQGEWTLSFTPSDWDQYIFAFALDEDLNITSEVQYIHLDEALENGSGGDEPDPETSVSVVVLETPNEGNVRVAFTTDDDVSYVYSVFPKSDFAEEADMEAAMTETIASYLSSMYGMYYSIFGEATAWNTCTDTGSGEATISYSAGTDANDDYYVIAMPAAKDGATASVYGQVSYAEFHYPLQ